MDFSRLAFDASDIFTLASGLGVAWLTLRGKKSDSSTQREIKSVDASTQLLGGWETLMKSMQAQLADVRSQLAEVQSEQQETDAYLAYLVDALARQKLDAEARGVTILPVLTRAEWRATRP